MLNVNLKNTHTHTHTHTHTRAFSYLGNQNLLTYLKNFLAFSAVFIGLVFLMAGVG